MPWTHDKARTAVTSLSRIRAAESPPDEHGIKTVWHQGAEGADLVSYVDTKGVVTEQALTLLSDHFVWTAKVGMRTGQVGIVQGSKGAAASDEVSLDRALSSERVLRAAEALNGYGGDDRYILHIKSVLNMARQGLQAYDGEQVTGFLSAREGKGLKAQIARRQKQKTMLLAGLGVAAFLVLLGGLLIVL